jgi:hypothetical protein
MFRGVRYDIETGLYYCGGPVYNPYTGRALQQNFGIHWERYSWAHLAADAPTPSRSPYTGYAFLGPDHPLYVEGMLAWAYMENGVVPEGQVKYFASLDDWYAYVKSPRSGLGPEWMETQAGWQMSGGGTEDFDEALFWDVQALICLGWEYDFQAIVRALDDKVTIEVISSTYGSKVDSKFVPGAKGIIYWNKGMSDWFALFEDDKENLGTRLGLEWYKFPPLVMLAHEMMHAYDYYYPHSSGGQVAQEMYAMAWENWFRYMFYTKVPGYDWVYPRPAYGFSDWERYKNDYTASESGLHPDLGDTAAEAWSRYWDNWVLKP